MGFHVKNLNETTQSSSKVLYGGTPLGPAKCSSRFGCFGGLFDVTDLITYALLRNASVLVTMKNNPNDISKATATSKGSDSQNNAMEGLAVLKIAIPQWFLINAYSQNPHNSGSICWM